MKDAVEFRFKRSRRNMEATFITTKETFPMLTNIIEKLDLKDTELIEIQITKLYIDETLKKEMASLLKDQRNIERQHSPSV